MQATLLKTLKCILPNPNALDATWLAGSKQFMTLQFVNDSAN